MKSREQHSGFKSKVLQVISQYVIKAKRTESYLLVYWNDHIYFLATIGQNEEAVSTHKSKNHKK